MEEYIVRRDINRDESPFFVSEMERYVGETITPVYRLGISYPYYHGFKWNPNWLERKEEINSKQLSEMETQAFWIEGEPSDVLRTLSEIGGYTWMSGLPVLPIEDDPDHSEEFTERIGIVGSKVFRYSETSDLPTCKISDINSDYEEVTVQSTLSQGKEIYVARSYSVRPNRLSFLSLYYGSVYAIPKDFDLDATYGIVVKPDGTLIKDDQPNGRPVFNYRKCIEYLYGTGSAKHNYKSGGSYCYIEDGEVVTTDSSLIQAIDIDADGNYNHVITAESNVTAINLYVPSEDSVTNRPVTMLSLDNLTKNRVFYYHKNLETQEVYYDFDIKIVVPKAQAVRGSIVFKALPSNAGYKRFYQDGQLEDGTSSRMGWMYKSSPFVSPSPFVSQSGRKWVMVNDNSSRSSIYDYHGSRSYRKPFDVFGTWSFGVEVEKQDEVARDYAAKFGGQLGFFAAERDGSLDDGGVEFITPVMPLFDKEYVDEKMRQNKWILDASLDAEGEARAANCGGHITISREGYDGSELLEAMHPFIPLLYSIYTKRLNKRYSLARKKDDVGTDRQAFDCEEDTLEIRLFSGIPSYKSMMFRIDLVRWIAKRIDEGGYTWKKVGKDLLDDKSELYGILRQVYTKSQISKKYLLHAVIGSLYEEEDFDESEVKTSYAEALAQAVTDRSVRKFLNREFGV